MGEKQRAIDNINHAKKHMIKASKLDPEAHRTGMCSVDFVCKIDEELEVLA